MGFVILEVAGSIPVTRPIPFLVFGPFDRKLWQCLSPQEYHFRIRIMTNQSNTGVYQHLGHEVSLYSGKTRAYLRYKKIPFDENISAKIYEDIK